MRTLNLKPTHKPVRDYYSALQQAQQLSELHEGNVAPLFAALLRSCASQFNWQLVEQYQIPRRGRNPLRTDGVLLDSFKLIQGVWEAKDSQDNLAQEVKKKLVEGYPKDNILFQSPERLILYQNGQLVVDELISDPEKLVEILKLFFEFQPPAYEQWETAVREFKERVPHLAQGVLSLIAEERQKNKLFTAAFANFMELCRQALNPNIAEKAVQEMLIQHLLTERIFRKIFNNPDFIHRNVIAKEIEKVIDALTGRTFSREQFLKQLDRFYGAIEQTAATIEDFSQKQSFLNTVYEQFFQGFSVKTADTHGIVYTPQPIVDFMVQSADEILKREFGKPNGLADTGVHILDPFVGTGNFMLRVMRQMPKSRLPYKYEHELHCNEVMLLPYYIASMNIEHDFFELTGEYKPFEGICFVDTFELAEGRQRTFAFVQENAQRVLRQVENKIFVILGNPPYNAHQLDENDSNKNRKYPILDQRVAETYGKDSQATNKNALGDMYVKAFRWACDRIKPTEEGIIAFVTNNSFIEQISFDGFRKHLMNEFSSIYILDLGGNVRKNPKLSGSTHNVFGIQVGVSINILVKHKGVKQPSSIFYAHVDEFWRREEKYQFLDEKQVVSQVNWQKLEVNSQNNWFTAGLRPEFSTFLPMGVKGNRPDENKIFELYSNGIKTNRDIWAYHFQAEQLEQNIQNMLSVYNEHVFRWGQLRVKPAVENFVNNDYKKISWSESLKNNLQRQNLISFNPENIRTSIYRPFTKKYLYFDQYITERQYQMGKIYPTPAQEQENLVICVPGKGGRTPFWVLCVTQMPNVSLSSLDANLCFPFYVYNKNGKKRKENISQQILKQFQTIYASSKKRPIKKWDIFYYIYALLHHPTYRENYGANLRLELPHIPFVKGFWELAEAGQQLAELHINYEQQPQYPLQFLENPDVPLNWRVEKMRLTQDKTSLIYNDFLTLAGIPPEVFEYKLGNRCALEWVIDQYKITADGRSEITNDPNRPDDPQYIVRLVGQIITVSLETLKIMQNLPPLEIISPT